ncbi:MAG: 7-carboxy-7-deazaguanine synthase QueE [Synechococcaceae bacterium WB9_2_112]|nr:7-carboxy-7-deazaguanine synthase QueE [Synechococcaceae bacterium WB9_2_112]
MKRVSTSTAAHRAAEPAGVSSLPVVETFCSLQGEGLHMGRSAFFIRLGGCTVGCSWCDTKHSWPGDSHPRQSIDALVAESETAAREGAAFVVITGGEPLHHDLGPLCTALAHCGLPLHLETSGVDPLSGRFDWITLSPKRHKPPREALLQHCDELKVVVSCGADLVFAEAMARQASALRQGDPKAAPALLLQPAWNDPEGLRLALSHVSRHPAWRLSLQTHKWLAIR